MTTPFPAGHIPTAAEFAARGTIANDQRNTSSGAFTAETLLQSVTFTALAGILYSIQALQNVQSTIAADLAEVHLRWAAGATVTTAGTQISSALISLPTAGRGIQANLLATFTPGAGQFTIGAFAVRNTGTGNISSFGATAAINTIYIRGEW